MAFAGSMFKTSTRLKDKTAEKRLADQHWRDVCRQVDLRDRYRCRACGCRTITTMVSVITRREHHHVSPRSVSGVDETFNVCCLCLKCHQERHITRALSITGNADGILTFRRSNIQTGRVIQEWESRV